MLINSRLLLMQMVQLLLELLLTGSGQLEPAYQPCSHATQQLWPLAVLQRHLSHAENAHLATPLLRWARAHSPAAVLLLRLTCKCVAFTLILTLVAADCKSKLLPPTSCAIAVSCLQVHSLHLDSDAELLQANKTVLMPPASYAVAASSLKVHSLRLDSVTGLLRPNKPVLMPPAGTHPQVQ